MKNLRLEGHAPCSCSNQHDTFGLVVLTGGPGAGKTAVLELARKQFCKHIALIPESASIIFSGGFWRLDSTNAKKSAQKAIYYVQRELETIAQEEKRWVMGLCDRGTIDGLAYWPENEDSYWKSLSTSRELEYKKYSCVIHLRTPTQELGYNLRNPVRIESASEAARIDAKIRQVWCRHPGYYEVETHKEFLLKAQKAMDIIRTRIPACCQANHVGETKLSS